ncbi:uncharacterized protein LOC125436106 [Sphaerodactylus townsendi]|uniref:uncharacterized protein LOC125436106 n=1 Tax=Sphaerodactylus townsendi TaxID=933632 RepID=UPI0020272673|nr:uncharacterized protein LOC125436106 [Sphaerodactylus townsendi]XP_048358693.1 uncharacterized protein LOC125436106 [Sphaerodactylus townsendi]
MQLESTVFPMGSCLVSLDVASLYTNIPQDEAREFALEVFEARSDIFPSTDFLITFTEIILEKAYFRIQQTYYMQIKGVAMGCEIAPSIANLFMNKLERDFICNPTHNRFWSYFRLYRHYIDDILLIISDASILPELTEWLNRIHPSTQFTHTSHPSHIPFLDTEICLTAEGKLAFKPFHKPTDRASGLHFRSYHPKSLKNSLPYSQLVLLKRNSSLESDFRRESERLLQEFRGRGFPSHILESAFKKVNSMPRQLFLQEKSPAQRENRITYALDYTPGSQVIRSVMNQHWHIVNSIPGCSLPPRVSLRKAKSLRQSLVWTDVMLYEKRSLVKGHYVCGKCRACGLALATKESVHPFLKFRYTFNQYTDCTTPEWVYLISCACPAFYVGCTLRPVKQRILEHSSNVRLQKLLEEPIVQHFLQNNHTDRDMRFLVLYKHEARNPFEDARQFVKRGG